jgi:hypothetical protein
MYNNYLTEWGNKSQYLLFSFSSPWVSLKLRHAGSVIPLLHIKLQREPRYVITNYCYSPLHVITFKKFTITKEKFSVIIFIRIMLSDLNWFKVITLSGVHCNKTYVLYHKLLCPLPWGRGDIHGQA